MDANNQVRSSIGRFDRRWNIRTRCRPVPGLAPHTVAGTCLPDLLPLLAADHWVQMVFTVLASLKLREHYRQALETAGDRTPVVVTSTWSPYRWQVRAWLTGCVRADLGLLPQEESWRAALVAADVVIGDYGSVTGYAAGIGVPVLLTADRPARCCPRARPESSPGWLRTGSRASRWCRCCAAWCEPTRRRPTHRSGTC